MYVNLNRCNKQYLKIHKALATQIICLRQSGYLCACYTGGNGESRNHIDLSILSGSTENLHTMNLGLH